MTSRLLTLLVVEIHAREALLDAVQRTLELRVLLACVQAGVDRVDVVLLLLFLALACLGFAARATARLSSAAATTTAVRLISRVRLRSSSFYELFIIYIVVWLERETHGFLFYFFFSF